MNEQTTIKLLCEESAMRIGQIQEHIKSVDAAISCLHERNGFDFKSDVGQLLNCLYSEELKEWRHFFMFGLALDDDDKDRIKAAAYQRFLNDKMHVAHWLNNGISPAMWMSADEKRFREMVKRAFYPGGCQ